MTQQSGYIPSSTEKKTAVLLYLLMGIIIMLHKDRASSRLVGHLHQALGWRIFFILVAFVSIVLVFIPLLSVVPVLLLIAIVGLWGWFVSQARSGKATTASGPFALFMSVGKWIVDVMDIRIDITNETPEQISESTDTSS